MIDIWDWELLNHRDISRWNQERKGSESSEKRLEQLRTHPLWLATALLQEWWIYRVFWVKHEMFHFWYQDLNEDGRHWLHGRSRIYFKMGCEDWYNRPALYFNWYLPGRSHAIEFTVGGEDQGIAISLRCWLFAIQVEIEKAIPKWCEKFISKYDHRRHTGIRFFEGSLWVEIWYDDIGYADNRGFHWSINLIDIILGKQKYSSEIIETKEAIIYFPEGEYRAIAKLKQCQWDRPRWKPLKKLRCEIECESGIPVPGKGDNSWDQGEDKVYSMTLNASIIDEGIREFIDSVQRDRLRYGGLYWVPGESNAS